MSKDFRVAIIGGGPGSVSLCDQIVRSIRSSGNSASISNVVIFEKSGHFASGLPYSGKERAYILNLPVKSMAASVDDADGFQDWLGDRFSGDDFPERDYFGSFLKERMRSIVAEARSLGVKITYLSGIEAYSVIRENEGFLIDSGCGSEFFTDVIFSTGHMPSDTCVEMIGEKGYYHNPWDEDIYDDLILHDSIPLLGSRLTAIDASLKLSGMSENLSIHMFSRGGLLPSVLSRNIPNHKLSHITMNNIDYLTDMGTRELPLDELMSLFWQEISDAEGRCVSYESFKETIKSSPGEALREGIERAEVSDQPWQAVLFSLYPIVPRIWMLLSEEDKGKYMKKYHSLLMTYLAAFPISNAKKILSLIDSGQLSVHGGFTGVSMSKSGFELTHSGGVYKSSVLVNATGPGYDPLMLPIYNSGIRSGLLSKNKFGGISVNPKTLNVIGVSGIPEKGLFAVGEPTKGDCLATTDMFQLNRQAARVARQIIGSHENNRGGDYSRIKSTLRRNTIFRRNPRGSASVALASVAISALSIYYFDE